MAGGATSPTARSWLSADGSFCKDQVARAVTFDADGVVSVADSDPRVRIDDAVHVVIRALLGA